MRSKRNTLAVIAAGCALAAAGLSAAGHLAGGHGLLGLSRASAALASSSNDVTACTATTAPTHTVAIDTDPPRIFGGETVSVCATATAATDTVTVTESAPTTATTATTTTPTTTAQTTTASSTATANLWVGTTGGSCTRSATPAAYDAARACASFQGALTAAQGGDTVLVADGTYPAQTLSSGAKATAVTFEAQDYRQALVGSLTINVDHVHFVGVAASGSGDARGDLDVCGSASAGNCSNVFTDIIVDGFVGKDFFVRASGVTVSYGEFGGVANICTSSSDLATEDATRFWGGSGNNVTPTNDTLEYSYIHDWHAGNNGTCDGTVTPTPHADCFQAQGGKNMLLLGNVFENCPSSDNQIAPFGTGNVLQDVTLQDNYYGQTACCNRVVLGETVNNANCSTLHVHADTIFYFSATGINQDGCSSEDISGNTWCTSTTATGCGPPPIPVDPHLSG